jgi:hypothetical protein
LTERETLIELWDNAWHHGLWAAPWSKALEDLTPPQATWKSHPGRHSIWQVVHHLLFWRQVTLCLARGTPRPDQTETQRRNWEEPLETTADAWRETVRRYEASQQEMVQALKTTDRESERFLYHLFHDNYHIGQIMQLRAMQDLTPIA